MYRHPFVWATVVALSFLVVESCSSSTDVPQLRFVKFSPTDTVQRGGSLDIVFAFDAPNSNLSTLYFKKVYVGQDTSHVYSYPIPSSQLTQGELTVQFVNVQVSSSSQAAIGDPPTFKVDYVAQYNVWLEDGHGKRSDTITTPTIYIKIK